MQEVTNAWNSFTAQFGTKGALYLVALVIMFFVAVRGWNNKWFQVLIIFVMGAIGTATFPSFYSLMVNTLHI